MARVINPVLRLPRATIALCLGVFIVAAAGHQPVITHVFPHDDPYLVSDAVFGVKDSLVTRFEQVDDAAEAARLSVANPFWTVKAEFVLDRE